MTKKDYELIADTIAKMDRFKQKEAQAMAEVLTYELIDAFKADNPRFDRDIFAKHINKQTKDLFIV